MASIGFDCELLLDGTGYFVKPGSYQMRQPRIRHSVVRADGGLSYVDLGPGKRTWRMTILCLNDLTRYDGVATGQAGQHYRDSLRTSYLDSTNATLAYSDPINVGPIAVHFDRYTEKVQDLHVQQIPLAVGGAPGLTYEVTIELIEA
jgi:hypothetical protein